MGDFGGLKSNSKLQQISWIQTQFVPNAAFYLERCEAAWSQSKHHCFLLQNLQEKHSASSPPLAQNWKGSDRKISPVHNFQAEAVKWGKKRCKHWKKNSLKVSVLAQLNGNFLRKSRVVIVFCCLERNCVWQWLWRGRGRQWPGFNQEP